MAKLRAGVLGLGIGRWHALSYNGHPEVDLVAVCDQDSQRLNDFCTQNGLRGQQFTSFATMLSEARLDVLSICTPDFMHLEHVEQALKAGCHIICEKPLATTVEDTLRMIDVVEHSGRTFMVSHQFRWSPMFAEAKRRADSGDLGIVFYMESDFFQNKIAGFSKATWYKDAKHLRYPILGTGCHNIDLLRWIGGDVVEVEAFGSHLVFDDFPTDDLIVALFRLSGGAIGKVAISYGCAIPRNVPAMGLTVFGSKGTSQNERLYLGPDQGGEWGPLALDTPGGKANALAVAHFVECVQKGSKPVTDVREGARNVLAALAGVEASQSHKIVQPVKV